jgi:hypothetical protein
VLFSAMLKKLIKTMNLFKLKLLLVLLRHLSILILKKKQYLTFQSHKPHLYTTYKLKHSNHIKDNLDSNPVNKLPNCSLPLSINYLSLDHYLPFEITITYRHSLHIQVLLCLPCMRMAQRRYLHSIRMKVVKNQLN